MKKVMVLFALSFFMASANYAQTDSDNRKTDTTAHPQKMNKKKIQKGKRRMDSATNGNGSLYPMNNRTGRADSTNSGNSPLPNQTPDQPVTPSPTPNSAPGTTPAPAPAPHK